MRRIVSSASLTPRDIWDDVRSDVLHRLNIHHPSIPFEDRVRIAEDVAREVKSDAHLFDPEINHEIQRRP